MWQGRKQFVVIAISFIVLTLAVMVFLDRRGSTGGRANPFASAAKKTEPVRLPEDRVDATGGDVARQADQRDEVAIQDMGLPNRAGNRDTPQALETAVVSTEPQDRAAPQDRSARQGRSVPEDRSTPEPLPEDDSARPSLQDKTFREHDVGAKEVRSDEETVDAPIETPFSAPREQIEREIAGIQDRRRDELLEWQGGHWAATGRPDLATAAYAMFLEEFGVDHPSSPRVAIRLAEWLVPFDPFQFGQVEGKVGTADRGRIRHATAVCVVAVRTLEDRRELGRAMLRLGGLYHLLGEWDASTAAWDQCASEFPDSRVGRAAAKFVADNFVLTGDSAAAADRFASLAELYSAGPRRAALMDRAEELRAQARRTPAWFDDPIASFQREVEERMPTHTHQMVFRNVMRWLRVEGDTAATVAISQWVGEQTDWPTALRIEAISQYATTLSDDREANANARMAAAEAVSVAIELAPTPEQWIPLSLWRAQLLDRAGRGDLAMAELDSLIAEIGEDDPRLVDVLAEQVSMLRDSGDTMAAQTAFDNLVASFPSSRHVSQLAHTFAVQNKESTR